jgi:LPXTG-site transpeptidase (sortase) family protein
MNKKDKINFFLIRSMGNFLLLLALYGVAATFGPVLLQETRFRIDAAKGVRYTVKTKTQIAKTEKANVQQNAPDVLGSLFSKNTERILIPSDTTFSILIPKIGASERIIPNVDPNNPDEFHKALLEGVAHAKGTVFPGFAGNTYLFAHSTDNWWNVGSYNAVFYLLKDLEPSDEVIIFFENKRYNYVVTQKGIADPSEVSLLVNNRGTEEKLILQTCWPPGTTWKRLYIIAKPKREI